MDINDFVTMGECEFGSIWQVASEDKMVVNVYQIAVYFSTYDFLKFAKMVETAAQNLLRSTNVSKEKAGFGSSNISNISNIRQFRVLRSNKEEYTRFNDENEKQKSNDEEQTSNSHNHKHE